MLVVECPALDLVAPLNRESVMVRHWQDRFRQCPVCNQLHHFIYVIQPGPRVTYFFECPVTKQLSDLRASDAVVECTATLTEVDVPVVPAPAKLST